MRQNQTGQGQMDSLIDFDKGRIYLIDHTQWRVSHASFVGLGKARKLLLVLTPGPIRGMMRQLQAEIGNGGPGPRREVPTVSGFKSAP